MVVVLGAVMAVILLPGQAFALTAGAYPTGIAAGPDGALWFTENGANRIGRIPTDGDATEFVLPNSDSGPFRIAAGSDGALWFTESSGRIGRITTDGDITEYPAPSPYDITAGPDGALWFTEYTGGSIGRIATDGTVTSFPVNPDPSTAHYRYPQGITSGPDGAIWFTEQGGPFIGRMTTDGTVSEYPLPPGSGPYAITTGPDGALWFTEADGNRIGRLTTTGDLTEYPVSTDPAPFGRRPFAITAGPDGALWFTEEYADMVGRITTDGTITEFPGNGQVGSGPYGIAAGSDGAIWFTEPGENAIGRIPLEVNSTSEDAPPGGTVSTNTTTSPDDPVGTSVTTPVAGTVTINESSTTTPDPTAYTLLGQQVLITAPTASAASPLVIEFLLDASVLPAGADPSTLQMFRDGVSIADCAAGAGGSANPDPCVAARAVNGSGGVALTVRTSHASTWNFGLHSAYAFGGFYAPIAAPPTLNSAQAGSNVSLRFSLGGNQGLRVLASGYPRSHRISCDSAANDLGDDAQAQGSLSYDSKSKRYTYAWKTSKAWASKQVSTCRQFVLHLIDGSFHPANVRFSR